MYINSNHIRIVKLIQNISNPNLEFMSEILNTGEPNIILHMKAIFKLIHPEINTFKKNEMVLSIKRCPNLVEKLSEMQDITKEERISFIIFSLLLKRELNLSELANFFSVTRRSLNNDILEIKEMLSIWKLEVVSYNFKGIEIRGEDETIRKLFNNFTYKAKIEMNELPKKLRNIYSKFFKDSNYGYLLEESKKFISLMKMDRFFNIHDIFATYALSFIDPLSDEPKIKDLSIEKFQVLIENKFSPEYSKLLFSALKETFFGNTPVSQIHNLILFVKMSNGELYMNDEKIVEKSRELKQYLEEKMNLNLEDMGEYDFSIRRMIFFSLTSFDMKLKDFNFLSLNISDSFNSEIIDIYLHLRKQLYNASFTVVLNLYLHLSSLRDHKERVLSKVYLLYKCIPEQLFSIIVNRLQKIYGVTILDCIDFYKADQFLETNQIDSFIILENFEYHNSEIEVRHLPFPL